MSARPKRPGPSLRSLFHEIHEAAARTGEDRHLTLSHKARVAVRVRDRQTIVTFSRPEKPLGDTELITFRAHCDVPADAERLPAEGQRTHVVSGEAWYSVSYRWSEGASQ